jgi:spore coat protein H
MQPDYNDAFLQDEVAKVKIFIDENDLNTLLGDSLYSDHHFPATFNYISDSYSKVIENIGFRVRGNTSRNADKKSFKVSFNEYQSGQKFKGIEKMNLIGQHNDPSLFRYWMSLKTLRDNGLICSRASFVELYINDEYKGLYLNVEHIDDEFLQKRFGEDDEGNLYKCLWGSDFTFWGAHPSAYYDTYELKTNKSERDYSDLIQFLFLLEKKNDADFPCFVEEYFEVDLFLKTLAVEMIIGHWDGHAFNKNNFYLYQKPSDGKFIFIEYDMDNTFGIDWVGLDWSTRDLNDWHSNSRPLVERLLAHPYYRNQFNIYLEEILTYFDNTDWKELLQAKQSQIYASVQADDYYTLDYGFQFSDFLSAVENDYGSHVTQGVAEYISNRVNSGWNQLEFTNNVAFPCETIQEDGDAEEEVVVEKQLLKIVDVLGREQIYTPNTLLIYIYSDGSSERILQLEN